MNDEIPKLNPTQKIMLTKISPCLRFDDQAEAAAHFYTAIFKNAKITAITRYGEAGRPDR